MATIDPRKFESTQQYLEALGFTVQGEWFVKGSVYEGNHITFPVTEIIKHTPVTFCVKAKARGWIPAS